MNDPIPQRDSSKEQQEATPTADTDSESAAVQTGSDRTQRTGSVDEHLARLDGKIDRNQEVLQEQLAEIQRGIGETWIEHEQRQDDWIRQLATAIGVKLTPEP